MEFENMSYPIRILHVVTYMGRGGLETMIMNYYRHIDRSKVQFDFLVHYEAPQFYDEEIEKSETKKTDKFSSSIWFEINIPKKDYLLHMDLPMREQPDQILRTLLSNDALAFLFRGEGIDMDKKVKQFIVDTSVPEDKKFDTYTREMKTWYDMKRNQIMVLDSGLKYMELVVSRTVKKDIEVASAYMEME